MEFFDPNNKLLQETMAKPQAYNKKVFDRKRRVDSETRRSSMVVHNQSKTSLFVKEIGS